MLFVAAAWEGASATSCRFALVAAPSTEVAAAVSRLGGLSLVLSGVDLGSSMTVSRSLLRATGVPSLEESRMGEPLFGLARMLEVWVGFVGIGGTCAICSLSFFRYRSLSFRARSRS